MSMFLRYHSNNHTASISKFLASISQIFRYSVASISQFQPSISKILRYSTGSILNVTTVDIDVSQILVIQYQMSKSLISSCHIVARFRRSFSDLRYRRLHDNLHLQHRNTSIPISKVRPLTLKVCKIPDDRRVTTFIQVDRADCQRPAGGPGRRTSSQGRLLGRAGLP